MLPIYSLYFSSFLFISLHFSAFLYISLHFSAILNKPYSIDIFQNSFININIFEKEKCLLFCLVRLYCVAILHPSKMALIILSTIQNVWKLDLGWSRGSLYSSCSYYQHCFSYGRHLLVTIIFILFTPQRIHYQPNWFVCIFLIIRRWGKKHVGWMPPCLPWHGL